MSPLFTSLVASADHALAADATATAPAGPAPLTQSGLSAAGTSAGGGFSPTFFLALLVAFAGLARLLSERLRLPHVAWRPTVFIALQERPG
jgi:hypothetical protein